MSKAPVIVFGDFSLEEATRFQQLGLSSGSGDSGGLGEPQGDGPPPVRFGSIDPSLHIAHSPPPLPQSLPVHPPYPHHPPPYLAGNHHPSFLPNLPPPHFGPPRTYYPPAPYYNSFGTFPHPGGPPLPYTPEYLYGRPLLSAYHGPVDPGQTLGLSSAPLGVLPPVPSRWQPHPLGSPPQQPGQAPQPPPGVADFPPAHAPPWTPPLHLPSGGVPFQQERPTSSSRDQAAALVPERGPDAQASPEPRSIVQQEEEAEVDGRDVQAALQEEESSARSLGASPNEEEVGYEEAGGPAEEPPAEDAEPGREEVEAPTGWGPAPTDAEGVDAPPESPVDAAETAAPASSPDEAGPSSEAGPPPAVEPARPKSWAALVGTAAGRGFVPRAAPAPSSSRTVYTGPNVPTKRPVKGGEKPKLAGPAWLRLLKESAPLRLRPRGLMNTGNSCFLNATLQALFACPPFLLLVNQLTNSPLDPAEYPMLWALVTYLEQFDALPATAPSAPAPARPGQSSTAPPDLGTPFSPDMFIDTLNRFSPNNQQKGLRRARQEDAQEFLSYVMDRMHEELLKLETAAAAPAPNGPAANGGPEGEDEWETVGPKNKSAVTRMHTHAESALSSIFGGELQSLVKTQGTKPSATVQPFTIVQLDISGEAVKSVEDALQQFAAPETLDGYRTKGKTEVAASKLLKIQTLPRVLVLHLMRFSFSGERGSTKVHKPVKFPPTLTIPVKLLTAPPAPAEIRRYELVASVSHLGKDPSAGHYTADARQEDGRWLRFDDSNVSLVPLNKVLHDQAYLLLYKRVVQ